MNREYYISTKDMTVGYHSVPLIKNIEFNVKSLGKIAKTN